MSGKKVLYDEDDFYDEDDADEDYYGDYDPGESQLVGKQSNKTPAKVARPCATSVTPASKQASSEQCRLSTRTRLKAKPRLGQSLTLRQQLLQVLLPWLARCSVASPKGVVRLFCSSCVSLH